MDVLSRLHILSAVVDPGKPRAYGLTKPFVASLRLALTGGGDHKSFGVPCSIQGEEFISVQELDEFARKQWEGVLGYMVGSTGISLSDQGVKLSQGVRTLLQIGGLVEAKGRHVAITKDGFAFILQEVNAQVWTILVLYLENAEQVRPAPFNTSRKLLCPSCIPYPTNILPVRYGFGRRPLVPFHARLPRTWPILLQSHPHTHPIPNAARPRRLWHNPSTHLRFPLLLPHPPRHNPHLRRRCPPQQRPCKCFSQRSHVRLQRWKQRVYCR